MYRVAPFFLTHTVYTTGPTWCLKNAVPLIPTGSRQKQVENKDPKGDPADLGSPKKTEVVAVSLYATHITFLL